MFGLAGRIRSSGGLKEKTLAAHRGGIKTFILPKRNAKDLAELPEVVRTELELVQVSSLDEVLAVALLPAGEREPADASVGRNLPVAERDPGFHLFAASLVRFSLERTRSKTSGRPTMVATRLVVHSDPEVMGGTPVFVGTRVPVTAMFDYLVAGDSLERFLDHFPTVGREQAVEALEMARHALVQAIHAHPVR